MIIKTVKVSDKGQISIPSLIRKNGNINKGDTLVIMQSNGKILIEKAPERIKDDFSDLLKHSESVAKDLWDNEEDEIWNDL